MIFLSYSDLFWAISDKDLLMYGIGFPFCISTASTPLLDASISKINSLSKLGTTSIETVVMVLFNFLNASLAAYLYKNTSFFNNWVRGEAILL